MAHVLKVPESRKFGAGGRSFGYLFAYMCRFDSHPAKATRECSNEFNKTPPRGYQRAVYLRGVLHISSMDIFCES